MGESIRIVKNLMVMVLSDVQFDKKTRDVRESNYPELGQKVRTTNESAIRALQQRLEKKDEQIDCIYAFATQTVQGKMIYSPDNVHKNIPYLYEGNEVTHLSYIQKRVEDIIPENRWSVIQEKHSGEGNISLPMNRILFYTLQIVERIQNDIIDIRKENPDVKIVLHADCTGGPRHAIMMLIDIIRLLQYNNVDTGYLFYSNWNRDNQTGTVETVNDVYDFYNLIAGAEEFVNFGSVKDIQVYFEHRTISMELEDLLLAMAEFADEVKLCRRWRFVDAINHLKKAIEKFELKWKSIENIFDTDITSNDDVRLNDMLMFQLLPQIHKDYDDVLKSTDTMSLIQWCLKQNLLQQALTLYTESIPKLFLDYGFLEMTEDPDRHSELEKSYRKHGDKLEEEFYFINRYHCDEKLEKEHSQEVNDAIQLQTEQLKTCFSELIQKRASVEEASEKLRKLDWSIWPAHIQNIDGLISVFEWMRAVWNDKNVIVNPGKYRVLQHNICKICWSRMNKGHSSAKPSGWDELPLQKKCKKLFSLLNGQMKDTDIARLGGGIAMRGSFNLKWRLLDTGDFVLRADSKAFYQIYDEYVVIKNERNHTNHAKEQQGVFDTAENLMRFMQKNLQHIEALRAAKGISER